VWYWILLNFKDILKFMNFTDFYMSGYYILNLCAKIVITRSQ